MAAEVAGPGAAAGAGGPRTPHSCWAGAVAGHPVGVWRRWGIPAAPTIRLLLQPPREASEMASPSQSIPSPAASLASTLACDIHLLLAGADAHPAPNQGARPEKLYFSSSTDEPCHRASRGSQRGLTAEVLMKLGGGG